MTSVPSAAGSGYWTKSCPVSAGNRWDDHGIPLTGCSTSRRKTIERSLGGWSLHREGDPAHAVGWSKIALAHGWTVSRRRLVCSKGLRQVVRGWLTMFRAVERRGQARGWIHRFAGGQKLSMASSVSVPGREETSSDHNLGLLHPIWLTWIQACVHADVASMYTSHHVDDIDHK